VPFEENPNVFQITERKVWSHRATVSLAVGFAIAFGFICGRFSAGMKPRLGWFDPDVLFVIVGLVVFVFLALLSSGSTRKTTATS
jgi:hypothetical protein